MARPKRRTRAEWTSEGEAAIVDLVSERLVAPWAEVESRITHGPWKDFHKVQPVPLNGARQRLRKEDPLQVIEETSGHETHPVVTLRVPFDRNTRRITRLRGKKRKLFRRYLSWTNNQNLCGRHAETIVLRSLEAAQAKAGIWVPPQTIGEISEVDGIEVKPGPLDAIAYVLDLGHEKLARKSALLVEVKNLRGWLYPWAQEVWQMLIKVAGLADQIDTVAILAAPHVAWSTMQLAKDLGFAVAQYNNQLFSARIDEAEFSEIVNTLALTILQHEGALDGVVAFLERFLRSGPAGWESDERLDWCDQQANRLALTAPIILEYAELAEDIHGDTRSELFQRFKVRLEQVAGWRLEGGY